MNNKKDIRWEQRFSNYKKAFLSLEEFINKKKLSKLELQGLVKAFEYTYELAWNTLKDYLEYQGETNLTGARDTLKRAFKVGLIEEGDAWLSMLESRNRTSHVYNEEVAKRISDSIINIYFKNFIKLIKELDKRVKKH